MKMVATLVSAYDDGVALKLVAVFTSGEGPEAPTSPLSTLIYYLRFPIRLIFDELNYDGRLLVDEHCKLMSTMTNERRGIYDCIMQRVEKHRQCFFFFMDTEELARLTFGEQCLRH